MEAIINDITEVEKELAVQISAQELLPHFERAYKRHGPRFEVKGFRKGKVPIDVLKKMFGPKIENDSLDEIATDIYREIAEEKNIRPVGEPILVDMNYKRGEQFEFKIKYEILPKIELRDYKGIPVEKLLHTVTQQEIDDEILRTRKANATMVESLSASDDEHVITADIQELDDTGFPIIGKRSENQRFYLADEDMVPEVKSALRSATVGNPVRVKYETKHEDHTHKAFFQATVRKIEKIQLPDVSDEFVSMITKGKVKSASEFREAVTKDLEHYWRDRSERLLVDSIAAEIIRRHDFPVPEALVGGIINRQLEDLKNRFPGKRFPEGFDVKKYREEMRAAAIWQAKWYLLREHIIEKEGMKVDPTELEKLAEDRSKQTGIEKEKLVDFFRKSEETKRQLLSDKLIEFLKSKATITEKETAEFF